MTQLRSNCTIRNHHEAKSSKAPNLSITINWVFGIPTKSDFGVRTLNGDIDLKSAAFVRSTDWTGDGSGEPGEAIGFRADPDTRSISVLVAILELLLDSTEIYHFRIRFENPPR